MANKIITLLLFAAAAALLYAWGLFKSRDRQRELANQLLKSGERAVKEALRQRGRMTRMELENCVKGLKASLFYSRQKAVVQDAPVFTRGLIEHMLARGSLVETRERGVPYYSLAPAAQEVSSKN